MKQTINYLDRIPNRNIKFNWTTDAEGMVTIEVPNKGFFNYLAQRILKKPPVTFVHLDKLGSFVWPAMDGQLNVHKLGIMVQEHFGDEAEPLYERLTKYFGILESYGFVVWQE